MSFLPATNRRTLRSYIDDLFDCAETRQDVLDHYSAIQELCGDRLERLLHDVQDLPGSIRKFVNQHYKNLRDTLKEAEKKVAGFQEELTDR